VPEEDDLAYLAAEIRGVLPAGWNLAPAGGEDAFDPRSRTWEVAVRDGAGVLWPLRVKLSEARRHGRLEALRSAADRLFRRALG